MDFQGIVVLSLIALMIGVVVALPILIPALRRAGQNNRRVRIAEMAVAGIVAAAASAWIVPRLTRRKNAPAATETT